VILKNKIEEIISIIAGLKIRNIPDLSNLNIETLKGIGKTRFYL